MTVLSKTEPNGTEGTEPTRTKPNRRKGQNTIKQTKPTEPNCRTQTRGHCSMAHTVSLMGRQGNGLGPCQEHRQSMDNQ